MRRFYRGSLALRVLAVCVLIFFVPLLIYFLIVLRQNYDSHLQDTVVRLVDLGRSRAAVLDEVYSFSRKTIGVIEEFIHTAPTDEKADNFNEQLSHLLTRITRGGDISVGFYTEFEKGQAIAVASSDPKLLGEDMSNYHFISSTLLHDHDSFFAYGVVSAERFLYVSDLVHDPQTGQPIGIVTLGTKVNQLIDQLVKKEDTIYEVDFSLLDLDDVIFASGDPSLLLHRVYFAGDQSLILPTKRDVLQFNPLKDSPDAGQLEWQGVKYLAVKVPLESTRFTLLLTAPEAQVFAQQLRRLIEVLIFFFLIFLIGGWIALWITRRMSVPWKRLGAAMTAVSGGDLTARYEPDKMGFEINAVGGIFNETIDSLSDQMAQAEAERVQKETLRQELDIGTEIQMAILPHTRPEFPGVEVAARYIPAKQVGGDFYDVFIKHDPEHLVLTVADAAGKGISACLYSLGLRSMLRSACLAHHDVSTMMKDTNNLFCEDTGATGMFVTAFTAMYHPEDKTLTYSSCGHNPALFIRASGEVEMLQTDGLAMGVSLISEQEEKKVSLAAGDLIVLYTDGVTEMHNEKQELYGEERLRAYLREQVGQSADSVADGILGQIQQFAGAIPPHDDTTIMVMRVN